MKRKKVLFSLIAIFLLLLNVVAIKAAVTTSEIQTLPNRTITGPCFQTMSYCGAWQLQLSCTRSYTSAACSRYMCHSCLEKKS